VEFLAERLDLEKRRSPETTPDVRTRSSWRCRRRPRINHPNIFATEGYLQVAKQLTVFVLVLEIDIEARQSDCVYPQLHQAKRFKLAFHQNDTVWSKSELVISSPTKKSWREISVNFAAEWLVILLAIGSGFRQTPAFETGDLAIAGPIRNFS
jgi:hypothetical protein